MTLNILKIYLVQLGLSVMVGLAVTALVKRFRPKTDARQLPLIVIGVLVTIFTFWLTLGLSYSLAMRDF
jgi:uncharacterized BrkB/YihY/UPF0761 family membrane protein